MLTKRAIVLFARAPEAEAAAKRLRVATTAPLFRALIAAWLRAAERSGAMPIVACTAADRATLAKIEPRIARIWVEQRGATFGDKLANAAGGAFALGFNAVAVAGIDAPPPADDLLAMLFASVGNGVPVVAPSPDGGVNVIALHEPAPELLASFAPRDPAVLHRCRAYFRRELLILPLTTDIDSAPAMRLARREQAWRDYRPLLVDAIAAHDVAHRDTIEQAATPRIPRAPPHA